MVIRTEIENGEIDFQMPEIINLISSEDENIAPKKCRTPKRTRRQARINHEVTPPKQKCLEKNISSDSDSRIELSPNTLLSRLDLGSPKAEKSVKKLFPEDKFKNARQALHSQAPEIMPGREQELEEIETFIRDKMTNKCPGTMYVSGPPGTGKTAALSKILRKLEVA